MESVSNIEDLPLDAAATVLSTGYPQETLSNMPEKFQALIDVYEQRMARNPPSAETIKGWPSHVQSEWWRFARLYARRKYLLGEKDNIPSVPENAPTIAAPLPRRPVTECPLLQVPERPPCPVPGHPFAPISQSSRSLLPLPTAERYQPPSSPRKTLPKGPKVEKGNPPAGARPSAKHTSGVLGPAPLSLPPAAMKAKQTGHWKGNTTVRRMISRTQRKGWKPGCSRTELGTEDSIPYDGNEQVECLWEGCSGHFFSKKTLFSHHILKPSGHRNDLQLLPRHDSQNGKRKDLIFCPWDGCGEEVAHDLLRTHLRYTHLGYDWRCCPWCNTMSRTESYAKFHGRAAKCPFNPENMTLGRLRKFLKEPHVGTALAHQRAAELLELAAAELQAVAPAARTEREFVQGSSKMSLDAAVPPQYVTEQAQDLCTDYIKVESVDVDMATPAPPSDSCDDDISSLPSYLHPFAAYMATLDEDRKPCFCAPLPTEHA